MCTECTGIFTSQSHIGKVWTTQSKWIWRSGQLCLVAVCESFIFFLKLILVDRQSWISREAGWKKGCKRANLWWASFTRRISAKMQKPHRPHLFHRLWAFLAEHCKTHPVQWLELSFSKDFFARPSEVLFLTHVSKSEIEWKEFLFSSRNMIFLGIQDWQLKRPINSKGSRKKNGIFMVRLTVRVFKISWHILTYFTIL